MIELSEMHLVLGTFGAIGVLHALGVRGVIPSYGYDEKNEFPAWVTLLILGTLYAAFVSSGSTGFAFLASFGAFKLGEYAGYFVLDISGKA